jgi:hypothetical protein
MFIDRSNDWTQEQQAAFNASRKRLSDGLYHVAMRDQGMTRGKPRCHRVHRTNINGCTATPRGAILTGAPVLDLTGKQSTHGRKADGASIVGDGLSVEAFKQRSGRLRRR